jgi:hypothetical protein
MIRKTEVAKNFVVYFKLGEFSVYFSTTDSNFVADDQNKFLKLDSQWSCLRTLQLANQLLPSEIYTFPLNGMNKEVFISFATRMGFIMENINAANNKNDTETHNKDIQERNAKIRRGHLNVTIIEGHPVNYVTFSNGVEAKVQKIIDEINREMSNNPIEKQRLLFKLDETKSKILSTQLTAMITARSDIVQARSLTFDANNLITSLDNLKPKNISNASDLQSNANAEHNISPALPPPDVRTPIPGVKDQYGNDVYERPEEIPTGERSVIYNMQFSTPVAPSVFTGESTD